jgi:hypothetical protein
MQSRREGMDAGTRQCRKQSRREGIESERGNAGAGSAGMQKCPSDAGVQKCGNPKMQQHCKNLNSPPHLQQKHNCSSKFANNQRSRVSAAVSCSRKIIIFLSCNKKYANKL